MRFHPNYPNDNNKGQRQLWNALKNAFERDEGVAYYRFPIFATTGRGRSEPDFLMIHRQYGIWVLESKGCSIGQIAAIEGHEWIMCDWYSESMSPVSQIEAQMFEVKTLVDRNPDLRRIRIPFEYRLVLPFVDTNQWRAQGYAGHPSTEGIVWLGEDINKEELRAHVKEASNHFMPELSDSQWESLLAAFRGTVSDEEPRTAIPNSPISSPSRIIHNVERRLQILDEKQDRIAQEVPEGPQRIRGLAGTGKTVLFARRVAQMHASHPEWDIALVYWSRSLNQQMSHLVERAYRRMTGDAPNWDKLHVWHAWGSKEKTGFYKTAAEVWKAGFLNVSQAQRAAQGDESPFEAACRSLKDESCEAEPFLDALVIDEGQDLPACFYQLAYRALRDPKRLYWAYDEAQGIDSLIVPNAAQVFGRDEAGRPVVDLSGVYPSGMQKAHNMNCCYRTPRLILTAAHTINMGLLREGGPLQGVTNKADWAALGYRVVDGDFSQASVKACRSVVIERDPEASGHPIDDSQFEPVVAAADVLEIHVTNDIREDVQLAANGIQQDLESGLRPEDIAVVCLESSGELLTKLADRLNTLGIRVFSLTNQNRDQFRLQGHVTLSGVRRAKGNEAYKVYAIDLHLAGSPAITDPHQEMVARNQAFVALTRSKLWCVAIGRQGAILRELELARDQGGKIVFSAFNQASLKRSMDDQEAQPDLLDLSDLKASPV